MFLSEALDAETVDSIVLVDKRWPETGQARTNDTQQSRDHIDLGGWPIALRTRKTNIKKSREQRQLTDHVFARAPGMCTRYP